ncbi:hypothetical protein V8F33_000010 [Rhypophila sp. PSN 637]
MTGPPVFQAAVGPDRSECILYWVARSRCKLNVLVFLFPGPLLLSVVLDEVPIIVTYTSLLVHLFSPIAILCPLHLPFFLSVVLGQQSWPDMRPSQPSCSWLFPLLPLSVQPLTPIPSPTPSS